MITTLREVLGDAQKNHYAVGLFNTVNLEMAKAVIEAAEELNAPVIIGSAEILLKHSSIRELADMLLPMARRAKVPVVVHLDHGLTYDSVIEALRSGFTSVMYDCSSQPFEENIRKCKEMSFIASGFGASLEAELGHVGSTGVESGEGMAEDHSVYTSASEAREFVEHTGIDALAIAIGSAHGPYLKKPKLDLNCLAQIRKEVSVPLVLHGGSGLSDEDFKNCIHGGIAKINIFTDMDLAGMQAVKRLTEANARYLTDLLPAITESIRDCVCKKMELFGSVNKG